MGGCGQLNRPEAYNNVPGQTRIDLDLGEPSSPAEWLCCIDDCGTVCSLMVVVRKMKRHSNSSDMCDDDKAKRGRSESSS